MRRVAAVLALTLPLAVALVLSPSVAGATVRTVPTVAHRVTVRLDHVTTVRLPAPAADVAVFWRGRPGARVTVAFSADGVHFGPARAAGRDELGGRRHDGTTYGALQAAGGAGYVRVTSDRPIPQLTALGLSDAAAVTRHVVAPPTAQASITEPPVVSRAGWGADESAMTWAPQFYPTKKLIVHHTDTTNGYTDQAGAESEIRSIYYYHAVTQGWGDIGYNFLIDKFGNIYEGRYSRDYNGADPSGDDVNGNGVTGAHTQGWNSGTVGIALLGTFTSQDVTPAARQALESMLAWEAQRNGIDPQQTSTFVNPVSGAAITTPNIAGHRDYLATACPGDAFYATLPTVRSDVAAVLAADGGTGGTADTTPPTAPTSLKASGGKGKVSLSWGAASDDVGVTGYQVWRSRSASTGFAQVATTSSLSYLNTGLARRTVYYFEVRAYDAAGNVGPFSNVASAKTS